MVRRTALPEVLRLRRRSEGVVAASAVRLARLPRHTTHFTFPGHCTFLRRYAMTVRMISPLWLLALPLLSTTLWELVHHLSRRYPMANLPRAPAHLPSEGRHQRRRTHLTPTALQQTMAMLLPHLPLRLAAPRVNHLMLSLCPWFRAYRAEDVFPKVLHA